jgi:hypothetical protein
MFGLLHMILPSMTILRYSGGYPTYAARDETGVNSNRYLVLRTTQELSYL